MVLFTLNKRILSTVCQFWSQALSPLGSKQAEALTLIPRFLKWTSIIFTTYYLRKMRELQLFLDIYIYV